MIENECKTPIGCLRFIFYHKYFYNKMDFRFLFSRDKLSLNAENHILKNENFYKKVVTWLYLIVDIGVFMTT